MTEEEFLDEIDDVGHVWEDLDCDDMIPDNWPVSQLARCPICSKTTG